MQKPQKKSTWKIEVGMRALH